MSTEKTEPEKKETPKTDEAKKIADAKRDEEFARLRTSENALKKQCAELEKKVAEFEEKKAELEKAELEKKGDYEKVLEKKQKMLEDAQKEIAELKTKHSAFLKRNALSALFTERGGDAKQLLRVDTFFSLDGKPEFEFDETTGSFKKPDDIWALAQKEFPQLCSKNNLPKTSEKTNEQLTPAEQKQRGLAQIAEGLGYRKNE